MIERITGERPQSCPWRAFYDPIVREAMDLAEDYETGNLAATTGPDTPAISLDAMKVYRRARKAVIAEDMAIALKAAEQKRRAKGG